ncbi:MAG TPA: Gfo/Idh/MocA family oxidoreductase [Candidatus Hydrogenedentes bacterium]|nr:Gfo/Idh/MocA family oxidoreductase [Candidatus Hydrogenedentota bacterium]
MDKIRIAHIGCGRVSGTHFAALHHLHDKLELVAVCDIVEQKAADAAQRTGAPPYTDYRRMLDMERPDVVTVATPSGLHPEMGIEAAERGIHVVSEKPLGCTLESADALIDACDRHRVHLFTVKQNRLNPTVQLLKRAVENGRFGRINLAQANVFWFRDQAYYDQADWRGTWEFDGGAFMNQASHYVDLLYWLIGPVESVMAFTGTLERHIEAEDTGAAVLRFQNGAMASVNVTMLTCGGDLEGSITLLGSTGSARLAGPALNVFERWELADSSATDDHVSDANYSPDSVYGSGHLAYYRHVLEVLEGGAAPNPDGREGRKSLEIILAIYKAAREGVRVVLPLQT